MKTLFIPAKSKTQLNQKEFSKLKFPKNLALFYSIQYETQAKEIKEILSKSYNVTTFSQVLGCSKPKIPKSTKAVLLIGNGKFHVISLAIETNLPIYIYDLHKLNKISEKEIQKFQKKSKGAYLNYLKANKVGILISTKQGQQNFKRAIDFKKQLKNKSSYLFIENNLNPSEFENFPQIQSWVNTACPRLSFDNKGIINLGDIK